MKEEIIPGVQCEDGSPVYVGRWYAAKHIGLGEIAVGKAEAVPEWPQSVSLSGQACGKVSRVFVEIPPIKFAADIEAERKAEAKKAKRQKEVQIILDVLGSYTGAWRSEAERIIDALDAHRAKAGKE